jgi:hypothetical protein
VLDSGLTISSYSDGSLQKKDSLIEEGVQSISCSVTVVTNQNYYWMIVIQAIDDRNFVWNWRFLLLK